MMMTMMFLLFQVMVEKWLLQVEDMMMMMMMILR